LTDFLGENAKQIFEKAKLPNDILGRIWNLSDTEQRGALGVTEFIIAMHLLASYKTGNMKALPNNLPAGLYEAASRRGPLPPPPARPDAIATIPQQFSGAGSQRNQSPFGRPPYGTPPQSALPRENDWLISPQEKMSYDNLFTKVDPQNRGFITGEQAVQFFSDSGLPEDVLAGIWDLADINSEGQLTRDEFAVAMYLIRQQRKPGVSLPATLPPNLVPPSLRNQARRAPGPNFGSEVAQPSYAPPPPQQKSAAEDLFGLDAFSDPTPAPAQIQQSTGGSAPFSKPFEADPFSSKPTSPTSPHPFQPSPRNPAATFKPFLPTSSFGQTLTTQSTGQSGTSATQSRTHQPLAMDDLLGQSDPEIGKKFTQESTELANMSNQMSTLRTQMQEVQNKKNTTESDLNSVSTQKRDLELRLSQFKSQYEQEVKTVKALEDRLVTSKNETRTLQQELQKAEASYQELQGQHGQVGSALEADQRENANLKERIRQINAEIGQLRPQLDKMRSDARQQKGMVAINKKQLATNEGERDKIRNEMSDLNKSTEENFRSPQTQTPSVVSPAASTASHNTNPFFRKSPAPTTENTMSPSGFSRETPHNDFDNVFGNTIASPQSTVPPTSFRSDSQSRVPTFSAPSGHSVRSSEGPDVPTPSTSPPLSAYQESPRAGDVPAPPESRQFVSSFLPLRDAVTRSESFSSSVKASAPASRYGGPGNETPTISKASPAGTPVPEKPVVERSDTSRTETDNFNSSLFDRNFSASPVTSNAGDAQRSGSKAGDRDTFSSFGAPSAITSDIPGAFPRDTASPLQQMPTGDSSFSNQSKANSRAADNAQGRSDPFGAAPREQPRANTKMDFDAAFAGFGSGPGRQFSESSSAVNGSVDSSRKFESEFPPIEDIAHDDDSDSTSEQGFADNFTSASPRQQRSSVGPTQQLRPGTAGTAGTAGTTGGEASADEYFKPPTSRLDSNMSGLPTPGAQKSPPTYDQTVGPPQGGSNSFPAEFGGLLPSRTDPTSPSSASQSPEKSFSSPAGGHGAALFGGSSSSKPATTSPPPADTPSSTVPSDAYHSAQSYVTNDPNRGSSGNAPPAGKSAFNDDFDAGFDDLTDAKEADEKADDDFMMSSQHREAFDEFNPVFDSPAASKANTMDTQQTPTGKAHGGEDSFSDFEHLSGSFGPPKTQQPTASSSQDWDAIFSNLDASQTETGAQHSSGDLGKSVFDNLDREEATASSSKPSMPPLGRAITAGTEHDDPILKKLTGMGYPRNDALSALEKYDYDINKVRNLPPCLPGPR
jgi:epidermal growth factor receptor substrate 15